MRVNGVTKMDAGTEVQGGDMTLRVCVCTRIPKGGPRFDRQVVGRTTRVTHPVYVKAGSQEILV